MGLSLEHPSNDVALEWEGGGGGIEAMLLAVTVA